MREKTTYLISRSLLLLSVALLWGGCSESSFRGDESSHGLPFIFNAEVVSCQRSSRATLLESDDISSIGLFSSSQLRTIFENEKLALLDGAWSYSSDESYMVNESVTYLAYSPYVENLQYTLTKNDNSIESVALPVTIDNTTTELLVSTLTTAEQSVSLSMQHAFAAIGVSIKGSSGAYTLTKAGLLNVDLSATMTLSADGTISWSDVERGDSDTTSVGEIEVTAGEHILVIPHAPGLKSSLKLTFENSEGGEVLRYVPLYGVDWQSGVVYNYVINIDL